MWLQAWRPVVRECVATVMLSGMDLNDVSAAMGWERFDDPSVRAQLVNTNPDLHNLCVAGLLKLLKSLNAAVIQAGYDKRSTGRMARHLGLILPALINHPLSSAEITADPFPSAWETAAHLLARSAYEQSAQDPHSRRETRLHNTLLLSGFFLGCSYTRASSAEIALKQIGSPMLSVRGSIVRIVENFSPFGVDDQMPRLSNRSGGINLHLGGLSDLLRATAEESQEIAAGNGVMHRVTSGSAFDPMWPVQARDVAYRQYEYTILGYMALGSIEQLIRAWASAKGVGSRQSLRPQEIASLIPQLGCSKTLEVLLEEICATTTANIRGRVMHGGLLEVETQRTEALLHLVDPTTRGYRSPFSPENVCQLCFECLELLDQEAATAGITLRDLAWSRTFCLTEAELDTGRYLYSEFLNGDEQAEWWDYLSKYLGAVAPNLKQFFSVGFMGWMGSGKDRLVRFMAAILIFESLYRITVQLYDFPVLQISGDRHIQYKMLDDNQLCAPEIVERLIGYIPDGSRPLARRVIELSVKTRNAFAHGAVTRITAEEFDCVGNLVVKTIQALVGAGMHQMTEVAAYYRWQKTGSHLHGGGLDNWLAGENEIYTLVRRQASER